MQNAFSVSEQGMALIKRFEGFSPVAYLCPAGKLTIGYGHVILDKDIIGREARITEGEGERLLMQDLKPVMEAVNRLVLHEINQNQFDALCSLAYNIGISAFSASSLLKLVNTAGRGADNARIIRQFRRWVHAGGKMLPGLKNRREAESDLFVL